MRVGAFRRDHSALVGFFAVLVVAALAPGLEGCGNGAEPRDEREDVRTLKSPVIATGTPHGLRVLSFNAHLVSEFFYDAAGAALHWAGNDSTQECQRIASAVLAAPGGYDVIGFNEVFDEGARDCLTSSLAGTYPYYAGKLEHGAIDVEEDSGVLIMSRLPFQPLPSSYNDGDIEVFNNVSGTNPSGYVNSVTFDDSGWPDSYAAKGAIHVRVQRGGQSFDIISTHMQSDDGATLNPGIRDSQMTELVYYIASHANLDPGSTIVMGDLNVQGYVGAFPDANGDLGTLESPTPAMQVAEYTLQATTWSQVGLYDAWRTTSDADHGITFFPEHTQRLDYMLMAGGSSFWNEGTPRTTSLLNADLHYPQWLRTEQVGVGSDHNAVAMDVGPGSAYGAPWKAFPVYGPLFNSTFTLEASGSNTWYYLPEPGTYTVALSQLALDSGITFDVFPANDLGRRLTPSPMFEEGTSTFAGCSPLYMNAWCTMRHKTFAGGTQPLYVRIYAPTGDRYGNAYISISRHDCSSRAQACELKPGGTSKDVNVAPYSPNFGTGYFVFRTLPTTPGVTHDATLRLEPYVNGGLQATLARHAGSPTGPVTTTYVTTLQTPLVLGGNEFVEMEVYPDWYGMSFGVGWSTDVTLLTSRDGRELKIDALCTGESGVDIFGSDEVGVEVYSDGVANGSSYRDDLDTSDSVLVNPLLGLGFKSETEIQIREYVGGLGGTVDNYGEDTFLPLHPLDDDLLYQRRTVTADGLKLEFHYGLTHSLLP